MCMAQGNQQLDLTKVEQVQMTHDGRTNFDFLLIQSSRANDLKHKGTCTPSIFYQYQ